MKENLSDFLKIAYKYNRVKDLNEAFEEYPVEEEWHKGKIENVLEENFRWRWIRKDGEFYIHRLFVIHKKYM